MTKRECAVIMAYSGIITLTGDDLKHFYQYVAQLMGCPCTPEHVKAYPKDVIRAKAKQDFVELCRRTATVETGAAPQQHGTWAAENSRPKSYKFICSVCGGTAYDRPDTKSKAPKRCSLKYCPHCGAIMEEKA